MKRPLNPTSRREAPLSYAANRSGDPADGVDGNRRPEGPRRRGMWLPSLIGERIDDMRAKGFPPHGRRHLLRQRSVDEGRRRALQRRLHGRADLARRIARDQPPLRLRRHTGPFDRRTRLPDPRILGARPLGRAAQRGAVGAAAGAHGRGDRPPGGGRNRRKDLRGGRRKGRYRTAIEQMYYGNQQFLFRLRAVRRRAAGRGASLVDRQVRRRYRQLDVAAPYGRLLALPHLCRPREPTGEIQPRKTYPTALRATSPSRRRESARATSR